jgi:glycosyltransferase involved in cell wall biosynthesis
MQILFTCGREPEYVRNDVILRALKNRYQVTEITDSRPGSLMARSFRLFPRLISNLTRNHYDFIYVGFYGYLLMPLIRRLTNSPIIFDAFVSNYDTLCFDRQQYAPNSLMGRVAFQLDRLAYVSADIILLDTATHQEYLAKTFNLSPQKLDYLYVSCNESMFYPRPVNGKKVEDTFRVLFYSSYLPLHGVNYVIEAAKLLEEHPDIQFRLIGRGMTYNAMRQLAQQIKVDNVEFVDPVLYRQLPLEIAQADLCLAGPFGDTAKAKRVIPTKLFQFLAMARPTIAGDAPANRELIRDRHHALLSPTCDAEQLASAIYEVKNNKTLYQTLKSNGYECYKYQASEKVIREKFYGIVAKVVGNISQNSSTF